MKSEGPLEHGECELRHKRQTEERAEAAAAYVNAHAAVPWIIGWHWFRWVDEPPDGRFDGEDNNFGLVNLYDEPYDALARALQEAHAAALAARAPGSD